jgi:large subunit ribosomal protein L11
VEKKMNIKLLVDGGSMKPGPTLSQKLGPAGININQVIQKVNDSTKNFEGMKVPVELDINPSTKEFEVRVFSPPVSGLLKKELGIQKGSGNQKKIYVGNLSIEQIIFVAQTKMPNLLCKDLKSAVKTIAGTCVTLGILIENQPAAEIEKLIDKGKFDKEIKEERTKTPENKKAELKEYFEKVKAEQEKAIKQEQAAKEAAAVPAEGEAAAPAKEGAKPEAVDAKKEAPKKEAAKPTAKPAAKAAAKPAKK